MVAFACPEGLIIDLFAGGGGASIGLQEACGRPVDIAVNHDPAAVRMHAANHPRTVHCCESIYNVDPVTVTGGRPVAVLWASPSCTHFSRARGGTTVSKQLRGLGWMVLRWAGKVRPQIICCENVSEWESWGPVRRGKPWRKRRGAYWRLFVDSLRVLGYTVDWQVLDASDYGAPTRRHRLFLVARCDSAAIAWPEPTHGPERPHPYRTAASCIDWSNLGRSVFERQRPLAPATCRRIAAGIARYVMQGRPFVIEIDNRSNGVRAVRDPDAPLTTITTENRHALVACFLAKHYGGVVGQPLDRSIGTVTAVDHHSLVAVHLDPCATDDAAIRIRAARCASFLSQYGKRPGQPMDASDPTIITVQLNGITYVLTDIRMRMLAPEELARAQGFPADYVLVGTQAERIGRIGNSVCPPVAAALLRSLLGQPHRTLRMTPAAA